MCTERADAPTSTAKLSGHRGPRLQPEELRLDFPPLPVCPSPGRTRPLQRSLLWALPAAGPNALCSFLGFILSPDPSRPWFRRVGVGSGWTVFRIVIKDAGKSQDRAGEGALGLVSAAADPPPGPPGPGALQGAKPQLPEEAGASPARPGLSGRWTGVRPAVGVAPRLLTPSRCLRPCCGPSTPQGHSRPVLFPSPSRLWPPRRRWRAGVGPGDRSMALGQGHGSVPLLGTVAPTPSLWALRAGLSPRAPGTLPEEPAVCAGAGDRGPAHPREPGGFTPPRAGSPRKRPDLQRIFTRVDLSRADDVCREERSHALWRMTDSRLLVCVWDGGRRPHGGGERQPGWPGWPGWHCRT